MPLAEKCDNIKSLFNRDNNRSINSITDATTYFHWVNVVTPCLSH